MLQVLGRLHPALVHFPIALLLAALVAELLHARGRGAREPSPAGFFCLTLGTLGALVAAGSGWLFAEFDPPGVPALLLRHRWSGIGALASACATLLSAWRWRRGGSPALATPTRIGLVLTAALAGFSGHLGGEMVYGEGFALEPLHAPARGPREPVAPGPVSTGEPEGQDPGPHDAEPGATSAAEPGEPAGPRPVDYLAEVQPLLERRCYECHGERKRPKGGLKLSDLASVLARDPADAAIVPGDPEASPVYQRIVLPAGDEDAMPPKGGPLAPAEIELIRRWIAEGAHWEPHASAVDPRPATPDDPTPHEATRSGPRLDDAQREARDEALARLNARGAHAQRLALDEDGVEVDLGVALPRAGDAELALLAGLEPCLVELSLVRTAVTDSGIARLATFEELRRLRLGSTAIGDGGLAALAALPRLRSLDLHDTHVGAGALATLRALPALERVYLGGTALDPVALERLAAERPDLVLERGLPVLPGSENAER